MSDVDEAFCCLRFGLRVDFTGIAASFSSRHVCSTLPVTVKVIYGPELLWYVQYE